MQKDTDVNNNVTDAPSSAKFILAELRGGPIDGQTIQIPSDQMEVVRIHRGRRLLYQRFNDKQVLRFAKDLERLLKGGLS